MKKRLKIVCYCFILMPFALQAQENWMSYSQNIPTQGYEGHRFRWQAAVRAEIEDDSAWIGLWARVDKQKGMGFFDNMQNRPIRSRTWKTYTVEGKIDSSAHQLAFGTLVMYNGKFYIDAAKLEIETTKDVWKTVFAADFEDNTNPFIQGVQRLEWGLNTLFQAEIGTGQAANGDKYLLVDGKNVPNYGVNNKVGKFADVNGIKLYYEIYGEGQPLVVLHGNGGSIENATSHYPELIKKYKVITIDSRAQGRSTDTDKPLTYDLMASDVNALLDQLNIDSVNIWGQSDGAILGLLLAMDYPKKVRRVLAFGANIQPDSLAIFPWAVNSMAQKVKTTKDEKERKLNFLMLDYPNIPYSKLAGIKAPVLIMAGDRDVIRPEHTLKLFQNIPNSHLCILPGSTHGASWNKRTLFMQLLNEFFDKPFEMPTTEDWYRE
jgi:pimeloyl-ACP methyl ester carboxylesterase